MNIPSWIYRIIFKILESFCDIVPVEGQWLPNPDAVPAAAIFTECVSLRSLYA
jgi:hypothetical protein